MRIPLILAATVLAGLTAAAAPNTPCGQNSATANHNQNYAVCAATAFEASSAAVDYNDAVIQATLLLMGASCAVECGDEPWEYVCSGTFQISSVATPSNRVWIPILNCWGYHVAVQGSGYVACAPCPDDDPIPMPEW